MVVDISDGEIDRLFHALADATRRDILFRVLATEQSVSGLARNYPMSITAVQKHVAVLAGAGLVTKRREGRELRVSSQLDAVAQARELLDQFEHIWRGRVDRMADVLADDTSGETT
jgi:DNA-binding transcriptional ArsR family regulator